VFGSVIFLDLGCVCLVRRVENCCTDMFGVSLSHSKSAGIKKAGTCTTTFAIFLLGWVIVRAQITYRSFLSTRLLESCSSRGFMSLKFSEKKCTFALCVLIIPVLKCR